MKSEKACYEKSDKQNMDNIRLLRVLSCLGVLICHLSQRMYVSEEIFHYTQFGQYGVYVFFMISGYLIANSYERYGRKHVIKYIIKRVLRVLALYYAVIIWFYITDTYIFHFIVLDETGWGWKRYFYFLNGFIPPANDTYGYWNNLGTSWTIPVFVSAYIIIPFYLMMVDKIQDLCINFWSSYNNRGLQISGGVLPIFI